MSVIALTENEVIDLLWEVVNRFSTQAEAAKAFGVNAPNLSSILHRKAAPGKKIVKSLGLTKVVAYVKL